LEKWRKDGHDVHSIIADPRFATTNPADFKLEADSLAWRLGFKAISVDYGPRVGASDE
jgi:hypothetical protein